jgi:Kef-type K+ transport system membrane component KefB
MKKVLFCFLFIGLFATLALGTPSTSSAPAEPHFPDRVSPNFNEFDSVPGGLTFKIMIAILQLAVVLVAAKLGGAVADRFKIPGVLGELAAGVIIGPFALGGFFPIPIHGHWVPLFPAPLNMSQWPLSEPFWFVAQLASVTLLFLAGLETNLKQFLSYLGPASIIAVGGVVFPFFFGAFAAAYFTGHAWYTPQPMFIGAIMVATSVGITARVLSDIKKLDTPEGVTILGAAVVDDVLGILVLAIVAAISQAQMTGEKIHVGAILLITVKAVGFWLGLTFIGLLLADHIERLFTKIRYSGTRIGLALALALFCGAVAEIFGLAFIIGAYSIGLALSKTKMAHDLIEDMTPINYFIVPIFFAAMGMLVNFQAMGQALVFGLVICILAIIGKVFGCGIPSLFTGFNLRGATRIGIGMLPRGEVALILAGVGLAGGYISQSNFGVAIMMTLVTTIIAPLFLVPAFKSPGSGLRYPQKEQAPAAKPVSFSATMSSGLSKLFAQVFIEIAEGQGYVINFDETGQGIYLLQKNGNLLSLRLNNGDISIHTVSTYEQELNDLVKKTEVRIIRSVGEIKVRI